MNPTDPSFAEAILAGLTPVQREAVTATEGPLLIVAGAGSGKTRVLTHRMAYLVRALGVSPSSVLAITFTNKAAGEMKERVTNLVGGVARQMWVMTFHAACARILRAEAKRLGYTSTFTIYDTADSSRLVSHVQKQIGIDPKTFRPNQMLAQISRAKNELIDFDTYASGASNYVEQAVAKVYRAYQSRLRESNAMDFDDLVMLTVNVLQLFPEALEHYRRRFRYLLVDEYQDTNHAQFELVRLLGEEHRNLCVVGDESQSIYAFRGASVRNILEFERDFRDAKVIFLEQNFRSTERILQAANSLIRHNLQRRAKNLWTDLGSGHPVVRFQAEDEHDEAEFVAGEIERLREQESRRFGDMAVFYRTNAQSRVLEEVFMRRGVPYRVVGGTRFYERKEIKDLLAYLRLIVNPADEVSLRRVINVPRRGIGDTTVESLDRFARAVGCPIGEAVNRVHDNEYLTRRAIEAVSEFGAVLSELRRAHAEGMGPGDLVERATEASGYLADLQAERTIEAMGRAENLKELAGVAREYQEIEPEGGLEGFLERVSLVTDADELDPEEQGVVFMTLHTAKGLEFPVVFITGMEEMVLPHQLSMGDAREMEEERRLCYVGITRARERLYLINAWSRALWGAQGHNPPSRFLGEIPQDVIEWIAPAVKAREAGKGKGPSGSRAGKAGAAPKAPERREPLELSAGDRVVHEVFGAGTVVSIGGSSARPEATINFESRGTKRLLLEYAPLTKA